MNKIIDSLEVMCEKDNPQDRKLLLLAHLVQDSVKGLAERQQELQGSLSETNRKLDSVLEAITKYKKIWTIVLCMVTGNYLIGLNSLSRIQDYHCFFLRHYFLTVGIIRFKCYQHIKTSVWSMIMKRTLRLF